VTALASGPANKAELFDPKQFACPTHRLGDARDHHTPAALAVLVDAINLEGDYGTLGGPGQPGPRRGAEDHSRPVEGEIDRSHSRKATLGVDHSTHFDRSQ